MSTAKENSPFLPHLSSFQLTSACRFSAHLSDFQLAYGGRDVAPSAFRRASFCSGFDPAALVLSAQITARFPSSSMFALGPPSAPCKCAWTCRNDMHTAWHASADEVLPQGLLAPDLHSRRRRPRPKIVLFAGKLLAAPHALRLHEAGGSSYFLGPPLLRSRGPEDAQGAAQQRGCPVTYISPLNSIGGVVDAPFVDQLI
jgi:hypothetical protein